MLFLSSQTNNVPILSIRSSGRIGTALEPVINPHNLHIDGFLSKSIHTNNQVILLDIAIRGFSPGGIVINDHNDLAEADDLVRLKPILDLNFKLIDKKVKSGGKTIGKVVDYAIDKDSLFVQKIYVAPPVWQSIGTSRLTFDRGSVIEVTDSYIVVSGPEEKAGKKKEVKVPKLSTYYSASANKTFTSE
jgi:hypothetical protein